ncbi:hypothetical protein KKB43_02085 [Patescibacteria group bacterium]|nr:hypothetical protein [Patescibacteria group bacterium]MBU4579783.1 hypothetical protein [Patescibacteria group bacterium]
MFNIFNIFKPKPKPEPEEPQCETAKKCKRKTPERFAACQEADRDDD